MERRDFDALTCPDCRGDLLLRGDIRPGRRRRGLLSCKGCEAIWPVRDGLPRMYREQWVVGPDRLLRFIYDGAPRLHDPAVRYMLPVMQLGGTEGAMRRAYLRRLELGNLRPSEDGGPLRILEVGVGAGANIPLVLERLPSGLPVEYWGLDLSAGMLAASRRRLRRLGERRARLLLGDAHVLPFRDRWFDRVFHVGGIGGFRDPGAALAEMSRVARPGSPIVIVDEQLEAGGAKNLWKRLWFRAVTFYDDDPRCPTDLLPDDAADVLEEQMSAFYYCLRFRPPEQVTGPVD